MSYPPPPRPEDGDEQQNPFGQQQPPSFGEQQPPSYGAPSYGTPSASDQPSYGSSDSFGSPPPPPASPYGAPASPYAAAGAYGGGPVGTPPPNNLVWAILTTVLCCLPAGVVSIVFAAQVNGKWAQGDVAGAQAASKNARTWAIVSAVLGVVAIIIGLASGFLTESNY